MFGHLLLFVAIVQAATLVRALRGDGSTGRGYAIVVGGVLAMAVLGMGQEERFLGIVAMALCLLTVIVPGALALLSKRAFAGGRFSAVAVLARIRAMLMPGAGLARQLPILEGLGVLETEGVDSALGHFQELAKQAAEHDEAGELAAIQEQIISMLFYDLRWDEGISYYERCFHPGYAVVRPTLALSLLRAYGESGRMHRAAGLLRAMEEGPLGNDPRMAELLGQARLTFIAYAGEASSVDRLISENHLRDLGVTPAAGKLFHGIALRQAGDGEGARRILSAVPELARARDKHVVSASDAALAELTRAGVEALDAAIELEPELRRYAQGVARRLFEVLAAGPVARGRQRTWATYAMVVVLGAAFGVATMRGGGGLGLLEVGAMTPELWLSGSRWRVLTAPWMHADLIGLLLDVYAIWIAGQVVERRHGWGRMVLSTAGGAVGGLVGAMLIAPTMVPGVVGTNLLAVAAIASALWTLLPSRSPELPGRARRNLAITLTLIFLANLLAVLPGPYGQGSSPVALLCCIVVSTGVTVGLPVTPARWLQRLVAVIAGVLVATTVVAAALVIAEDEAEALVAGGTRDCQQGSLSFRLPSGFIPVEANDEVPPPMPIAEGFVDTLELGGAGLVQWTVVEGDHTDLETAWFAAVPSQREAMSTVPAQLGEGDLGRLLVEQPHEYRARDLLQNGEPVARVFERRVTDGDRVSTVVIVASPPRALSHSEAAYAAALRSAVAVPGSELGAAPQCSL